MITVRDLSWQYEPLVDGGKPVDSLKHVSFDIKSGSFVGVIGPTGAGKSTLCMALAGIIPNLADGTMTGLVEVNGMNTSRHSVSALSERIGYVQQDPEAQLFCASVEDEIAFPLENRDIIDKQIDVMLDLVGMTGYRKRVPTSLSGGQMQRVAIAAALAAEPDVLILDEPTAALDPEGKQEVFDVLERIRQTRSMTVIMAEQDTEHIAYWADQVLFMVNGELVRNGDASLFVREKGLLESSGVQVADDPLPQVKAVQQGKKHKKDKKNQPERSKDVVISLDHVSYQYERGGNASKALDDVTFDIERGSFRQDHTRQTPERTDPTHTGHGDGGWARRLQTQRRRNGGPRRIRLPESRPSDLLLHHQGGNRIRSYRAWTGRSYRVQTRRRDADAVRPAPL